MLPPGGTSGGGRDISTHRCRVACSPASPRHPSTTPNTTRISKPSRPLALVKDGGHGSEVRRRQTRQSPDFLQHPGEREASRWWGFGLRCRHARPLPSPHGPPPARNIPALPYSSPPPRWHPPRTTARPEMPCVAAAPAAAAPSRQARIHITLASQPPARGNALPQWF